MIIYFIVLNLKKSFFTVLELGLVNYNIFD